MALVLIRHAEPEWVKDGLSVVNPPLTERGLRQAELLGRRLETFDYDHVFASPLQRTHLTALPTLTRHNRPLEIEPFLEEIREPSWHGAPAEETVKAYRREMSNPSHERWNGLQGGESVRDFVARIHIGATDFLERNGVRRIGTDLPVWQIDNPGEKFVFFAHAGTNSVLICHLLGLPATPWEWERFIINHASITTLKTIKLGDGYAFSLERLSDVDHLPAEDRTR